MDEFGTESYHETKRLSWRRDEHEDGKRISGKRTTAATPHTVARRSILTTSRASQFRLFSHTKQNAPVAVPKSNTLIIA